MLSPGNLPVGRNEGLLGNGAAQSNTHSEERDALQIWRRLCVLYAKNSAGIHNLD